MPSLTVDPQFGSPAQVAAYTGLSPRTVRRLYSTGKLKAQKLNRRIVIDYSDALDLVRRSPFEVTNPASQGDSAGNATGAGLTTTPAESAQQAHRARSAFLALDDENEGFDPQESDILDHLLANLHASRGES